MLNGRVDLNWKKRISLQVSQLGVAACFEPELESNIRACRLRLKGDTHALPLASMQCITAEYLPGSFRARAPSRPRTCCCCCCHVAHGCCHMAHCC